MLWQCNIIQLLTYVEVDMECYCIDRRGAEVNMIKFTVQQHFMSTET